MTYRSYEARIQRIAVLTKTIRRYAKLIAAVLLTSVVLLVGYLFARGLIIGGVTCNPVLNYGETLSPESFVLLGKPVFEYASYDAEDWTTTSPTMPGKYRVRAVSQRSFGIVSHSKPTVFTIEPLRVTVTVHERELEYGMMPTADATLLPGDVIDSVGFVYDDLSLNPTLIHIPVESVRIVNGRGDDVTAGYKVITEDREVTIKPREITVTVEDAQKVYDGTPLTSDLWTLSHGSLLDGDVLTVSFSSSQTDVGTAENLALATVTNADGVVVNEQYKITYVTGTLLVTPRPLTITTTDEEFVYNGKPHSGGFVVNVEELLPAGHTLSDVSFSAITDAGTQDNSCTYKILNAGGKDVTGNFEVTHNWGELLVTPRPIILTTPDDSKVYDGTPLSHRQARLKSGQTYVLVDGHRLDFSESAGEAASITHAGTCENMVSVIIRDGNGKDCTDNYALSYECGILEVLPLSVVITTPDQEWIYDGLPHSFGECDDSALLDGHRFEVVESTTVVDYSPDGYANTVSSYRILDGDDQDVTDNYAVTFSEGRLTVKRREIVIKTPSATQEYNARPFSAWEGYTIEEGSLVEGHFLSVESSTTVTDVSTPVLNEFTGVSILAQDGSDVTANYRIVDYVRGTISVTPRSILVMTGSARREYDATPLSCLDFSADALIDGHTIVLREGAVYPRLTNVGELKNIVSRTDIRILADGVDVTANYVVDVSVNCGMLTVDPRPVTVRTGSASKIYDGADLLCTDHELVNAVEGHYLAVVNSTRIRNVGTAENVFAASSRIMDANGVDVSGNYAITYEYGTLTVTHREIALQMGDATREYDDTRWGHTAFTVISDIGLVPGHTLVVTDSSTICDVGTVENQLLAFCINAANGEDVTANYTVSSERGILTVTPRALHIKTPNADQIYNGYPLSAREGYATTGLVNGHGIIVRNSTELVLSGNVANEFEIEIQRADGSPVSLENYTITYTHGRLVVRKMAITMTTDSPTYEYNGQPWSSAWCTPSNGTLPDGHWYEIIPETYITDVGAVPNVLRVRIFNDEGVDVTDTAFEVSYVYGTIAVTPRYITVISDNEWNPFEYDGTAQTYNEGFCISNSLPEEHRLQLTTEGSLTLPTETAVNRIVSTTVLDENGNDVTHNYVIDTVEGVLYMNPRQIEVKPQDAIKEYDGLPLTSNVPQITHLYGGFALVDGHYAVILTDSAITEIGVDDNYITSCIIYDADGRDVTAYYSIFLQSGWLEVTARQIDVRTMSDSKVYDGTVLDCPEFTILSGNLAPGHEMFVASYGGILDVGVMENYMIFAVRDEYGNDVTANYYIMCSDPGMLEITPRPITLETPDASKIYDGEALSAPGLSVTAGSLADGHSLDNSYGFASLTAPGWVDNTCTVLLRDAYGNDVTYNYDVTCEWGELEVKSGGYLDENGDLTKDPLPDVEKNENNTIRVQGTTNGTVYLRFKSFGSYTGLGFAKDVNAFYVGDDMVHPQLWVAYLLEQAGRAEETLQIQLPNVQYLTPYYLMTGGLQGDDVGFSEMSTDYALTYIPGSLNDVLGTSGTLPPDVAEDERIYRDHVYANYLDVPEVLRAQLQQVAEANSLGGSNLQIIFNVANYVRNLVPYDKDFEAIPEDVQDIVSYFLTGMDGAICQHYAATATMLYRTMGIPARYCIGYVAETVAGEWVDVGPEQAHAWVEIYVDGMGWLPVEVTNSFAADMRLSVEFKPYDIHVTYDGKAHGPVGDEFWETTGNLPAGYRIVDVVYEGTQVNAGRYHTRIRSLRILDTVGNDVTDMFNIAFADAELIIDARELVIKTGSLKTSFDGLEHKNTEWEFVSGSLADGHVCEGEVTMTIREPGVKQNLLAYFTIKDQNGVVIFTGTARYDENGEVQDTISDYSGNYVIRTRYGSLEVSWN